MNDLEWLTVYKDAEQKVWNSFWSFWDMTPLARCKVGLWSNFMFSEAYPHLWATAKCIKMHFVLVMVTWRDRMMTHQTSHALLLFQDAFSIHEFFDYCCFCKNAMEFSRRYAAYRYYRSKGWVVKDGQMFGVHFGNFDIIFCRKVMWLSFYFCSALQIASQRLSQYIRRTCGWKISNIVRLA